MICLTKIVVIVHQILYLSSSTQHSNSTTDQYLSPTDHYASPTVHSMIVELLSSQFISASTERSLPTTAVSIETVCANSAPNFPQAPTSSQSSPWTPAVSLPCSLVDVAKPVEMPTSIEPKCEKSEKRGPWYQWRVWQDQGHSLSWCANEVTSSNNAEELVMLSKTLLVSIPSLVGPRCTYKLDPRMCRSLGAPYCRWGRLREVEKWRAMLFTDSEHHGFAKGFKAEAHFQTTRIRLDDKISHLVSCCVPEPRRSDHYQMDSIAVTTWSSSRLTFYFISHVIQILYMGLFL